MSRRLKRGQPRRGALDGVAALEAAAANAVVAFFEGNEKL
jgi:hypothetical protein